MNVEIMNLDVNNIMGFTLGASFIIALQFGYKKFSNRKNISQNKSLIDKIPGKPSNYIPSKHNQTNEVSKEKSTFKLPAFKISLKKPQHETTYTSVSNYNETPKRKVQITEDGKLNPALALLFLTAGFFFTLTSNNAVVLATMHSMFFFLNPERLSEEYNSVYKIVINGGGNSVFLEYFNFFITSFATALVCGFITMVIAEIMKIELDIESGSSYTYTGLVLVFVCVFLSFVYGFHDNTLLYIISAGLIPFGLLGGSFSENICFGIYILLPLVLSFKNSNFV